ASYVSPSRITNGQVATNRWDQDRARPAHRATGFEDEYSPQAVAFDGSYIWVTNGRQIRRLNPVTMAQVGSAIAVEGLYLAFDGTNMWVSNFVTDTVTRINAATGSIVGTPIAVDDGAYAMTFDGTNMWVSSLDAATVTRINAATGSVVGTPIAVGANPRAMTFDGTNMWVASSNASNVTAINASTGAVVTQFSVPSTPRAITFDGRFVWVAGLTTTLTRIRPVDPYNGFGPTVAGSVTIPTNTNLSMAFDGSDVWIGSQTAGIVTRVDAASATVTSSGTPDYARPIAEWRGMAFDGSNMWLVGGDFGPTSLYQGIWKLPTG
ncbi:MAG: hypothetical protein ACKOYM_07225, partial [Actinomycetes bacterium]